MPDDARRFNARTHTAGGLIARYEAIAQASRDMLVAARADDWNEVARLEACCRALIAELKAAAPNTRLSATEQRRRIELLRGILADDGEIRDRAEPWLRQLERLIAPGKHATRRK